MRSLTPSDIPALYAEYKYRTIHTLSVFSNSSIRALIHEVKFHSNHDAETLLAELLRIFLEKNSVLSCAVWIPIPLSQKRLRTRGYNQTEAILKRVPMIEIRTNVLYRSRDTRAQTELTRAERLKNMSEAFTAVRTHSLKNRDVVLVDDVTTTGATLMEAQKALTVCNPRSITLVALSH